MNKLQTEKVPIFMIYKQNGQIKTDTDDGYDCKDFELYGFLKCFIKHMEKYLIDDLKPREDDDDS